MVKANIADDRFAEELTKITSRHRLEAESPVALLAAALACHGFTVREVGDLDPGNERPWQRGYGYGPFVWLWSQDGSEWLEKLWEADPGDDQESSVHTELRDKIVMANLRDRLKLLHLLGEFYSRKRSPTPLDVRLIISDLACGSSLLKCQGGDVMTLPENELLRASWLIRARNELHYFAKFLFKKFDEQ